MHEFRIRTEDFTVDEILDLYVETDRDRHIVQSLKSSNPVIIEGSRGTGKSFLLRVAEAQLLDELKEQKALPVYVSFVKSSLVYTDDRQQFQHWMLARICDRLLRTIYKQGWLTPKHPSLSVLAGGSVPRSPEQSRIEAIASEYENSYTNPGMRVSSSGVPSVEEFRDAVEDLCDALGIRRVVLMFDEAAHIFRPEQQRQFFTLFRDLRSPQINCNAAVYPGVTMYGTSFQTAHDATVIELNRDILHPDYRQAMQEIVSKQADDRLQKDIHRNGENFNALAYAVSGNPRLLLKTVTLAPKLNNSQVTSVLKNFYRTDIWAEHSELAGRYAGHKKLVDWGRAFVENTAIPDTRSKNELWEQQAKNETTAFIWIHRDAPECVREAMRLLAYTGIVTKGEPGIVGTRAEIGTRYTINLGCLVAPSPHPIPLLTRLATTLTVKRFTEYGANHPAFHDLADSIGPFEEPDMTSILRKQLDKPVSVLEITVFQKDSLRRLNINTVGEALRAREEYFQQADYIGPVRSRQMKNAVTASVFEYLSG